MMLRDERRQGQQIDQDWCLPAGALAQPAAATGMPGVVRARRCGVMGGARRVWLSVRRAVGRCGRAVRGSPSLEHGRVSRGYQLAQQHDRRDRARGR
jgi:hypothetical protein